MDHDLCPKGLAGHQRRVGARRRALVLRAALFAAAAGYALVIVALARNVAAG